MRHAPFINDLISLIPDPLSVSPTHSLSRTPFPSHTWYNPGVDVTFPLDHLNRKNEDYLNISSSSKFVPTKSRYGVAEEEEEDEMTPTHTHRYSSRYSFALGGVDSERISIPFHLLSPSSPTSTTSTSASPSSDSSYNSRPLLHSEDITIVSDGLCGSTCAVFVLNAFTHHHCRVIGTGGIWR